LNLFFLSIKNTKAKTKQDKIREKIALQQAIIDAKKEKVQYLREERTTAKEEFLEVNDLTEVTNIREAWLQEMEASDAYISVQTKKEKVQQVNDRLELATQNRDIKKTRITLIKARLEKLKLKLQLNNSNKDEIKKRMKKLRAKLEKKEKKLKVIKTRIEKIKKRKIRVQNLKTKLKFSYDIKTKNELEAEEIQLDIDL
jgi:hypothetical protein